MTPTAEQQGFPMARMVVGVGLGVLSGALAVVAAPHHGFGWLVLVAGVPMLVAQFHVLPARLSGVAPALAYGIAAWGTAAVLVADRSKYSETFIWAAIVGFGLVAGVAGRVERALWDAIDYRWWVAAAPLAWGLQAMVRIRLPGAGTDGFIVHDLFRHPSVLQPVGVVGVVGLEMAIVLVNVVIAALVMSALGHPAFPRSRALRLGVGLTAGLAIWVGWSLALLDDPPATVRIAAVQPNLDSGGILFATSGGEPDLGPYTELTERAVDDGAQLVVWPEYGLSFDPCDGDKVRQLAQDTGAYIVAAYGLMGAAGPQPQHFNEAVLVTPDGDCLGPYAKQHPVPMINERSDSDHGTPVFDTEVGRVGMVICYDLEFTDVSRALAAKGAQFIAAPSDDWPEMSRYHIAPLVFRAIENGVATAKADLNYDSALIDPHGRIVAEKVDPDGTTAVVVADVPLGTGQRTFWNRYAGYIDLLYLVAALAVATVIARDLLRRRRDGSQERQEGAEGPGPVA
jgi:apolipoprotein N-acyltransferase